ncbi:hypothetical protein AK812_SmicGene12679 [Symbiodinium microadriaticum]|uniref:Uncharacterized protein n=1 Tax=Symbiodinium microadriaticum TaxID=2951 RepID=A0A1Q9EA28_SYMMI|nr:hypothetical protein AK812_SmicGene12679 [Symbiodinium microadriaticum]
MMTSLSSTRHLNLTARDFVPLPDNDMHRTPFPVVHLIRKVDLSGDSIIAEANELRRLNADRFRAAVAAVGPRCQHSGERLSDVGLAPSRALLKDLADMLAETKQLQKLAGCEEEGTKIVRNDPGMTYVPAQTLPLVPEGQPLVSKSRTERLMDILLCGNRTDWTDRRSYEAILAKEKTGSEENFHKNSQLEELKEELKTPQTELVKQPQPGIKTKFKDCLGRPLVSPQFEVFPNLGDLDGLTMREQKARYEARFAEGPVSGAIKFKVVTETGGRLEIKFNLFIGDVVQGPLVHNFADHVIAGFEFSVEVIEINGVGVKLGTAPLQRQRGAATGSLRPRNSGALRPQVKVDRLHGRFRVWVVYSIKGTENSFISADVGPGQFVLCTMLERLLYRSARVVDYD